MKNKNGFTLVELLAVIVIMVVIATLGVYSVIGINARIKQDVWNKQVALIEKEAKNYGEDNKMILESAASTCGLDDGQHEHCIKIVVNDLLENKYLSTKEKYEDGRKKYVNESLDPDDEGYDITNNDIYIYLENNTVYAKYVDTTKNE